TPRTCRPRCAKSGGCSSLEARRAASCTTGRRFTTGSRRCASGASFTASSCERGRCPLPWRVASSPARSARAHSSACTRRRRFPFIHYVNGSAEHLDRALPAHRRYDTIVYSDVIYYFKEAGKRRSLKWIAQHLAPGGLAFIAGWAPGGKYLDRGEFHRLVD